MFFFFSLPFGPLCSNKDFFRIKWTNQIMRPHFAEYMYEQGKINFGASPQADFIQNYFLWKRMFRKQNFRQNKGTFGTKTLVLALLDPFLNLFNGKKNIFSTCTCTCTTCTSSLCRHFLSSWTPGCHNFAALCRGKILRKNDLPIILAQKSSKFNIKAFV